jgi:hypothetical protein
MVLWGEANPCGLSVEASIQEAFSAADAVFLRLTRSVSIVLFIEASSGRG